MHGARTPHLPLPHSSFDGVFVPARDRPRAVPVDFEQVAQAAFSGRRILRDTFLLAVAGGIVALIVLLKSKTAANLLTDPILLGYTFFVTLFQLSRIVGALMYKASYHKVIADASTPAADYWPTITFVVPCMNEENAIKDTLLRCFEAHYPRHLIEVIVINDGSTDGTLEKILEVKEMHPDLVVVDWKHNQGKRHGMAEGFRRAAGEIVIQLDSDSWIEPRDIKTFIDPFRNPEVGAVSAHTDPLNASHNLLTKMQAAYYFMSFRILKAAESTFHTVFCCSGCASAYRKEAVMPILDTWLNERFLGKPVTWGDDRAITNWVIKRGFRTLYTDLVQAYTICPDNFRQFLKQQIRWKKGWLVNSIFASRFIIKRDPFVAFTYFFPLMFVTIMTPFMAARAFLYTPFAKGGEATVYYVVGVFLIAGLLMVFYRLAAPKNPYWPYLFLWAIINMLVLSYLLIVALCTIQNRGWGTRTPSATSEGPDLPKLPPPVPSAA